MTAQSATRHSMTASELDDLQTAVALLENPGLGAKIADLIGTPIEKAIAMLPARANSKISEVTQKVIEHTLNLSLKTLGRHDPQSPNAAPKASNRWHMAATAASGAIGGAFGMASLTVELPISTAIIMRSIADIARSEGADLEQHQTRLDCVQILALGGRASGDDAAEVGYFAVREAMAKAVSDATGFLAKHSVSKESGPALVRLISQIAERYSITVTEKAAATLVPLIGAVSGAVINTVFIHHFQNMARGHFIVRRLEHRHGKELVEKKYQQLRLAMLLQQTPAASGTAG